MFGGKHHQKHVDVHIHVNQIQQKDQGFNNNQAQVRSEMGHENIKPNMKNSFQK